eukprot:m.307787 g.307787  ORF g.307787 m.307787 type:complete len:585 (-) comp20460_c0_seq1:24-1778(-)
MAFSWSGMTLAAVLAILSGSSLLGAASLPSFPPPSSSAPRVAVATTPPPYTPSGDPMYDIMELMSLCMDALTLTDHEFLNSSTHVVNAIGDFGDKIVYTERLINKMGIQIGWMADKIVETERICANLTRECFCNRTIEVDAVNVHVQRRQPEQAQAMRAHQQSTLPSALTSKQQPPLGGPWDAMIEMMLESVKLFNQMSRNISSALDYEVDAINEMGDNIVDTECLIMKMGLQIGVMADRIVATEKMMANVSATCCGAHPQAMFEALVGLGSPHPPTGKNPSFPNPETTPPPHPGPDCDNSTRHPGAGFSARLKRPLPMFKVPAAHATLAIDEQLEDIWVDMVKKLIEPLMEAMSKTMTAMAQMVIQGTNEIMSLASDIIATERAINAMGMAIGQMADCIVATENLGFTMMKQFCKAIPAYASTKPTPSPPACPPIKPVHPVNATLIRLRRGPSYDFRAPLLEAHAHLVTALAAAEDGLKTVLDNNPGPRGHPTVDGIDPARDYKKMVALCKQFTSMVGDMAKSVATETVVVTKAIDGFADRILTTINLINDMAGQINVMAGRIVTTIGILSELETECAAPARV